MIKEITPLIAIVLLLNGCSSSSTEKTTIVQHGDTTTKIIISGDCKSLLTDAKRIDSILIKSNSVSNQLAEEAINAFNNFASTCIDDTLAPIFLLKAGQVAQSIAKTTQAEVLFKKCINDFKSFKNRGAAMFLLAQLYDDANLLNNEPEAKKVYEQIIKQYPNTPWDRDAKVCIKNLGKSDEELVQEFLKKNKTS